MTACGPSTPGTIYYTVVLYTRAMGVYIYILHRCMECVQVATSGFSLRKCCIPDVCCKAVVRCSVHGDPVMQFSQVVVTWRRGLSHCFEIFEIFVISVGAM